MAKDEKKEIRADRFTWKAGEVKFITPEENKKQQEAKDKEKK